MDSAIATSVPLPAPTISTSLGGAAALSYGRPYCASHCSLAAAGTASWCGMPFTWMFMTRTPARSSSL
ncbi:hypothetical protein [Nonomuraea dietziae]|uniref:hypothetical protein n=1 Tax=Nonomuraea dietziae TaxID=65515 RepID=UPI0031D020ED